jgi:site-specific DNA recombinase
MGSMARARIYKRISDDREGREIGVGRQDVECHKLAAQLGAEIVGVYMDNDAGASTLSKSPRPDYKRLLEEAEQDPDSLILAYSNSRLTRRPSEWNDLIELYERTGVTVHTCTSGRANLATADGRAVARTIAAWDAAEAERTGERVKLDVDRRANAGLPHGGNRAFGWTRDHELDPYEHPILVELANRALAGEAVKSLARDLTERGVPLATWRPPLVMKPWPYQTVRKMLTNPRIAGFRTQGGEIIGKATWPAAVDEETFRQLDAMFSDQARHTGGKSGRVHLLTGLARCGECDRPIAIRNTKSKARGARVRYWCEPCGLYRAIEPVDAYVRDVMIVILEHYDEAPPSVDPRQAEVIERLRQRIEDAEREFALDDDASPARYRKTLRLMQGRLKAEEAKLLPPRRHHVVRGVTGADAVAAWDDVCSLDRKRAIIDALVEVRIHRAPTGRKPFDPETVSIEER